jgi:hypothetical protein
MDTDKTGNLFTIKIFRADLPDNHYEGYNPFVTPERPDRSEDPYKRINLFHIRTNMSLIEIYNKIAKAFVQHEHKIFSDVCVDIKTCKECLGRKRTLYPCLYDSNFKCNETECVGSKKFRDYLLENNNACIYHFSIADWLRIYISVEELVDPLLAVNVSKEQIAFLLKKTINSIY